MIDLAYKSVQYDIYDPSNSVAAQYWQMGVAESAKDTADWKKIGQCVNQGLPVKENSLFQCTKPDYDHAMWGCIHWKGIYWIYRLFLTGRDRFDRPGRYFFVLFKFNTLENLPYSEIIRIIHYLENQTTNPLDLEPLQNFSTPNIDAVKPIEIGISNDNLKSIFKWFRGMQDDFHAAQVTKRGNIISTYNDLIIPETSDKLDNTVGKTVDRVENPHRGIYIKKRNTNNFLYYNLRGFNRKENVTGIFSSWLIITIIVLIEMGMISGLIFAQKRFNIFNIEYKNIGNKMEKATGYSKLQIFFYFIPNHILTITLSFNQIETIIVGKLPSSSIQRQWWENSDQYADRPQAKAWLNARFKVDEVNVKNGWVRFSRIVE